MLSNFETARQKLMQIILSGQLQLAEKLAQPQLLQLRQRISIFAHLEPLSAAETAAYIQHRLRVAGRDSSESVFSSQALTLIARESQGIPRNINNICFNALTLGCALQRKTIDAEMIRDVLVDLNFHSMSVPVSAPNDQSRETVDGEHLMATNRSRPWKIRAGTILVAVCAVVALFAWLIQKDYHVLFADSTVAANSAAVPNKPSVNTSVDHTGVARESAAASSSLAAQVSPEAQVKPPVDPQGSNATMRLVPVRDGQSLYSICVESFGACRPEVLREIIKINPSITDPNHIVSGQKVAIPALFRIR